MDKYLGAYTDAQGHRMYRRIVGCEYRPANQDAVFISNDGGRHSCDDLTAARVLLVSRQLWMEAYGPTGWIWRARIRLAGWLLG